MRIPLTITASFLSLTTFLLACSDDDDDDDSIGLDAGVDSGPEPDPDASTDGRIGMWAQVDDETPVQLFALGVDSNTFAEVTARFGRTPEGLEDVGPAPEAGGRTVVPWLYPDEDTDLFDLVTLGERSRPHPGSGDLGILFGGGGPQPIGLLLPAVQKVREAAARSGAARGTRVGYTFDGDSPLSDLDGVTLEPLATEHLPPPYLDVNGCTLASAPDLSDAQRVRLAPLVGKTFHGDITLKRGGGFALEPSGTTARFDADAEAALDAWRVSGGALVLVMDVVDDGGRVLNRFRVPRAEALGGAGLDILIGGARATFLQIPEIAADASDPSHEIALFDGAFASFDPAPFADARATLDALPTLDDAVPSRTVTALQAYWLEAGEGQRAPTITSLRTAIILAADQEGLLCTVAMPLAGRIVQVLEQSLADGAIAGSASLHRAVADFAEAYFELGEPTQHPFVGGMLDSAALANPIVDADAETACQAILSLHAQKDQDPQVEAAVDAMDWRLLGVARTEAEKQSARYLDRLVVELVALLDSIADETAADAATAIRDASAKVDEILAALDVQAAAAASRHTQSSALVSTYR